MTYDHRSFSFLGWRGAVCLEIAARMNQERPLNQLREVLQ
jgi:hypothetical protein